MNLSFVPSSFSAILTGNRPGNRPGNEVIFEAVIRVLIDNTTYCSN